MNRPTRHLPNHLPILQQSFPPLAAPLAPLRLLNLRKVPFPNALPLKIDRLGSLAVPAPGPVQLFVALEPQLALVPLVPGVGAWVAVGPLGKPYHSRRLAPGPKITNPELPFEIEPPAVQNQSFFKIRQIGYQ
jgi:hypothetical protein